MKPLKYMLLVIVAGMILIQFINRPDKIHEPLTDDDIGISLNIDPNVIGFLKDACYDCHSNQPKYPWYFKFAPINWSIAEHIEMGRAELNFSEWASYSKRKKAKKLGDMVEEVEGRHMPLAAYLSMHPEARITQERLDMLKEWVDQELTKIEQNN